MILASLSRTQYDPQVFQHEKNCGHDTAEAIRRTFVTVGSALVMTTVVMVSGFGCVMTSHLPTHFLFASMAFTTIAAALVGDLLILPALLAQFPGNENSDEGREAEANDETLGLAIPAVDIAGGADNFDSVRHGRGPCEFLQWGRSRGYAR